MVEASDLGPEGREFDLWPNSHSASLHPGV